MKKISLLLVLVLSIMSLSMVTYASGSPEEIAEELENFVYIDDTDSVAVEVQEKKSSVMEDFDIEIIEGSIIPIFEDSLEDIAENRSINPVPYTIDGAEVYLAQVKYISTGKFAGEIQFCVDNDEVILHQYTPMSSPLYSMDIKTNARALSADLSPNLSGTLVDSKLTWIEGAGYSVVSDDGSSVYVTSIGMQMKDSPLPSARKAVPGMMAARTISTLDENNIVALAHNYTNSLPDEPVLGVDGEPALGGGFSQNATMFNGNYLIVGLVIAFFAVGTFIVLRKKQINK